MYFRWEGSPGAMDLLKVGRLKVRLTRWNNVAGYQNGRIGNMTWWYRKDAPWGRRPKRKWQLHVPMRPFKVGRKSLYFWVVWH